MNSLVLYYPTNFRKLLANTVIQYKLNTKSKSDLDKYIDFHMLRPFAKNKDIFHFMLCLDCNIDWLRDSMGICMDPT